VDVPRPSAWDDLLSEIRFFLHAHRSGVEVRRFAIGSKASIGFEDGRRFDTYIRFVDSQGVGGSGEEQAIASGFVLDVDGLVVRVKTSELRLPGGANWGDRDLRGFRTAYFSHRVIDSPELRGVANQFEREWLHQIYLSALASEALEHKMDLPEAHASLHSADTGNRLCKVLNAIFQTLATDEHTAANGSGDATGTPARGRLHQALEAICRNDDVIKCLATLAPILWSQPSADWRTWAVERFKATLGSALLEACQLLCPEIDVGELILDIAPGPRPSNLPGDVAEIWLTESTLGGGGVLEQVFQRYTEDPRRFLRVVESTLGPSDFELVDAELRRVVDWAIQDGGIQEAFASLRLAGGHEAYVTAFDRLLGLLADAGAAVCHPVIAALAARVLRPGSNLNTDRLLGDFLRRWISEEKRLGIEIDARVFAYLCSHDRQLDEALGASGFRQEGDAVQWRFGAVYSMLWPRGWTVRAQALSAYNPFCDLPPSDRELVLQSLKTSVRVVGMDQSGWESSMAEALIADGEVIIQADDAARLRQAVLGLMSRPLDVGYLHLFPRVSGFDRGDGVLAVRLELREAVQ